MEKKVSNSTTNILNRIVKSIIDLDSTNHLQITPINKWISNYDNYFQKLKVLKEVKSGTFNFDYLPNSIEGGFRDLSLNIYEELKKISSLHAREDYLRNQINAYFQCDGADSKIKKWIQENSYLGKEVYSSFVLDYLDHDSDSEYLNVFIYSKPDLRILIDKTQFKYTIHFLDIFEKEYWLKS